MYNCNKKYNLVFIHQLLCTTIFFGYESLCWHSKLPFFINYTDNVCLKIPLWIFKNKDLIPLEVIWMADGYNLKL